jgi:hypothetical protein
MRSVCDLQWPPLEHIKRSRFRTDPKRPYIAGAVSCHLRETVFLKRYDLSAWAGTRQWFRELSVRCDLIEKITQDRTTFLLSKTTLYRISFPVQGLHRCGSTFRISDGAYAQLVQKIIDAHTLGVVHGDITARNIRARAEYIDIFDWEPILLAPGVGPAKEPVPKFISDPPRWLGAWDLLPQVREKASVYEIDYQGLVNIRKHFC